MKIAINIHPLKTGHKDRGIGFYTVNLIDNLKKDPQIGVLEFMNLSEVKDVDLVHYPWFDFFFHTLPFRKQFKTIVTIHDVIPLIFPQHYPAGIRGNLNLLMQKLSLRNCSHVITDSNISKNDISSYLKINKEKISVVHLAANENFKIQSDTKLIHVKRKYHLPDKFLLYVGDANWVKNLPFLIESFYKLVSDLSDVKLVLVNGVFLKKVENIKHPELEPLRKVNQLIKNLNLENNIIRPGDLNLEELVSFYNLATVYIQPSIYEGFGLPLVEAFSCGTPVISSNRGSLPEIGGSAPIYFDPTDINKFVSILREVLQDKSLQNKLSKLSLKRTEEFSWEKVVEDIKKVYFKVIND